MNARWALCGLALAGCARIKTTVAYTDTLLSRATNVATVDGSLRYVPSSPSVAGTNVVVRLKTEETCRTKITPIYRRTAHITRETRPDATGKAFQPGATGVLGGLVGIGGISMITQADHLSMADARNGEAPLSPDGYRGLGAAMIGVGAVLGVVAIVDAYRLRDESKDQGERRGRPDVSEEVCHRKALTNKGVTAQIDRVSGFVTKAATNENGLVRLSMLELPATALSGHGLTLVISIDDASVPIKLGASEVSALRENLDGTPDSKISQDREAMKTATCQRLVDEVSAQRVTAETSDRHVERLRREWDHAKTACGDKWLPDHDVRVASFKAEIETSAKERATRACQTAVATAREAITIDADDVASELELARKTCDGVAEGAKWLASLDDVQRKRKAERQRAEKLAASADALAARIRANDAVGLRALLAKDPEVKAALQRIDSSWALAIAAHWIGQLERGAGNHAQLCAARVLVQTFAGEAEWNRLRAKAVERNGVTNGARIAKELNAGGCS